MKPFKIIDAPSNSSLFIIFTLKYNHPMKKILILSLIIISISQLTAQNNLRSSVNGSVLLIPSAVDNKTSFSLVIFRGDLDNITTVSTNQGEVTRYSIGYTIDGKYFSKNIEGNQFEGAIASALKTCPDGTKIYFDQVVVKSPEATGFKGGYVVLKDK